MQENALARLLEAIDYLKDKGQIHKQQDIADALEMDKGRISDALKGKAGKFTEGFLRRFASAYGSFINEAYLLEGVGQLAKPSQQTRPHIPLTVAAGHTGGSIQSVSADECEFLPLVPGAPDYDFSITVEGDSMEPEMHDGDMLLCEWIDNLRLSPREFYVIDTDEGAVVKKIEREGNALRCISLNPAYPPFTQPLETILRIACVRTLLRNF